jgi:phosphatidylserine/phosphatidylglycerophosphate/cardiolipin synthase-like enzyme
MKLGNKLIPLIAIMLITIACASTNMEPANNEMITSNSIEDTHSAIQYYFTSPNAGHHCELSSVLINDIDHAEQSIDIALYNINMQDVAAALIRAAKRGVPVRIVLDDNKRDNSVPSILADSSVSMVYDPDKSTMHNKFMIIDDSVVWSGSMNFTESGCEDDYNNMVRVENERLATNYTAEFTEMFEDHSFSANSPANTPYQHVQIGDVMVENYFSPDDGVRKHMIDVIDEAQYSIVIMAYSFTSDDLADAIIDRYKDGVSVHGVMDADQIKSNSGGEYEDFLKAGIDVQQDTIPGQMHHKVIIIDEQIVIMGSYNFSGNAEKRNDENVLIIHSSEAAQQFLQAYEMIEME